MAVWAVRQETAAEFRTKPETEGMSQIVSLVNCFSVNRCRFAVYEDHKLPSMGILLLIEP